jgi:DNA-binding NarL/FixJ family response regulator
MPPPADGRRNGNARLAVLICDDYEAIREALCDVIAAVPTLHVVGQAADGAEAIAEASRLQPDIILLDLAMPLLSGLEALPELRVVAPDATIIVLSGFGSAIIADQVRAAGADGYLEKGCGIDEIVTALTSAVPPTAHVHAPSESPKP